MLSLNQSSPILNSGLILEITLLTCLSCSHLPALQPLPYPLSALSLTRPRTSSKSWHYTTVILMPISCGFYHPRPLFLPF